MARALDQIIAELDPGYAGSRKTTQTQLDALPGETTAQASGLQAQADQSHTDILDAARRRGMGFSGVPIGEQVKYDSTVFKPALANLYSSQNTRKSSLEEALNSLYRDQRNNAMTIQQSEQTRDEQIRQFNETMNWNREQLARQEAENARDRAATAAAASAGIGSYLGGGSTNAAKAAQIQRTAKGGYNFYDAAGQAISAGQYAKLTGTGYRELLSQMAKAGDKNANIALQYVGNDGNYYLNKNAPSNYATNWNAVYGALNALGAQNTWR
jgi:hypothetical protein